MGSNPYLNKKIHHNSIPFIAHRFIFVDSILFTKQHIPGSDIDTASSSDL